MQTQAFNKEQFADQIEINLCWLKTVQARKAGSHDGFDIYCVLWFITLLFFIYPLQNVAYSEREWRHAYIYVILLSVLILNQSTLQLEKLRPP